MCVCACACVEEAAHDCADENEIFGYNFLCKQKLGKFSELPICCWALCVCVCMLYIDVCTNMYSCLVLYPVCVYV